jgi:hypothetical protein
MKKYYLKATGCTCYDGKGITFPEPKISAPIEDLAKIFFTQPTAFGKRYFWQAQFHWTNQPEVLCFDCEPDKAKLFELIINRFCNAFVVVSRDW